MLATLLVLDLAAALSALFCACTPTLAVEVKPAHTGERALTAYFLRLWCICCTERAGGPSDLSLLRGRCFFDSGRSGVFLPSAPADLCCGVRVPHDRCLYGLRNKVTLISAHPSAPADLSCGVRVPHDRCLCGLRNKVTLIAAHTKPAVLNLPQPRHCPDSRASGVGWPSVQSERSSCRYAGIVNSL